MLDRRSKRCGKILAIRCFIPCNRRFKLEIGKVADRSILPGRFGASAILMIAVRELFRPSLAIITVEKPTSENTDTG
jgi:hypothetical protein